MIGTGPAGAAAAWTLWRAGIAVTVLEAGGEGSASGLTVRAPGLTLFRVRRPLGDALAGTARPGEPPVSWFYELSAGGISNHWTCAVPRFAPEDFDEGAREDERYRWPLSYRDLVEHYPAMERALRIAGSGEDVAQMPGGEVARRVPLAPDWQPIVEQARARGQGLTSLPLAWSGDWTVTRSGTPFNSFTRMLASIPRSARFEIRFGARVTRLEWSAALKRVTRVIYRDSATGAEQSLEARAFVVAAGALNSTRLLLESSSPDFPAGLGNTDDVLGHYLHDHPLGKLAVEVSRPISIHPPTFLTRSPYQGADPLSGVCCVLWSGTGLRLKSLASLSPGKSTRIGFNLFGMLAPEVHNRVELPGPASPSPAGLQVRIRFGDRAEAVLLEARARLLAILEGAGLKPSIKLWFVEPPGTSVHYGGTVRMHSSPRYGMLDGWNRMHAVPNVLVVDASAFTTGPEKNPTLTVMALAARAATKLAQDLRS